VPLPTVAIQRGGSWTERAGADAARAEELGKGDQQVDGKDDDFSHRADRIMTSGTCKTARSARVPSHCEFATHK
jgi:hypothetical protein